MAQYKSEKLQDKRKIVKIAHDKCEDSRFDFVIFPFGLKYNVDIQSLRRGDVIVFLDGSEHYVDSIVKVPIRSAIAESLCRLKYNIGIMRAYEIWRERLRLRKENVKAMNNNECLIVFYHKQVIRYE